MRGWRMRGEIMKLDIKGMTCNSCQEHIHKTLKTLEGVNDVSVSFPNANAQVVTDLSPSVIISTIKSIGYEATVIDSEDSCCETKQIHIAIIGSGSGAFAAGIKAAEGGAKVTIIEAADVIGGCCVNVGCVPSKIMIRSAHLAQHQRSNPFDGLADHEPVIDRSLLAIQQKNRVDELRQAKYESILENNPSLNLIKGFARFKDANILEIKKLDGEVEELCADKILIATGSKPFIPPIEGLSSVPYWTSTEALFAQELPEKMVVIGSSVIAVELAQAYQRLGTKVTMLARNTLLYSEEPELGKGLQQVLENEGMQVLTNTQAQKVTYEGNKFYLDLSGEQIVCDRLLIAAGRTANTNELMLKEVGVKTNNQGAVEVNDYLQTNIDNIFAVGDCSTMPQFVYVAAAAGTRAAINMTGGKTKLDLSSMPAVIFTDPQVATVGLSESQANSMGIKTKSRLLELEHVPRALANFDTHGFVKIVANENDMQIVGIQILAPNAGEMIQTAVLALHSKMTVDQLAGQLFPYLTMVEGLKLCAQTFKKDVKELSCCAG